MLSRDIEKTADWAARLLPRTPQRDELIRQLNELAGDAHAMETYQHHLEAELMPAPALPAAVRAGNVVDLVAIRRAQAPVPADDPA